MQRADPHSATIDSDAATTIAIGRHDAGHIVEGVRREWLVTNGYGDYGIGTTNLLATRRYHGLLVAACDAPVGRRMLVPFIDETVRSGGARINLGSRRWADGSVDPDGHRAVAGFALEDGIPTWRFELEGARLEKRIVMLRDARGVAVVWTLADGGAPIALDAAVFVEHRSHHRLDPEASWSACVHSESEDGARAQIELPANAHAPTPTVLHVAGQGAALSPACVWWRRHALAEEAARGYDAIGSALHALTASFVIAPGQSVALCISLAPLDGANGGSVDGAAIIAAERARARRLVAGAGLSRAPAALRSLALAADGFVVKRARRDGGEGRSIIAGYPWFEDWGRDAMLSLRGLCLATGRADDAKLVLETFADRLRDGLLPNRFPDLSGVPEYHSADAPLLFLRACCDTYRATRDDAWIARLWPRMRAVVAAYARGTMHGIGVDSDGLVRAGEAGLQLTWMDAKIGDTVVTPRIGKPVELSALWIDALRSMCEIAPDDTADLVELAAQAERSFARYWNPATQCLIDVLDAPAP
ncbi:MAG: amylo-alpha-1,6-glucosidase, partial [Planctomycetota bacterium]